MKLTKRTIIIIDIFATIANVAWGIYCWHQYSNPVTLSISMLYAGFCAAMTVDVALK